MRKTSLSLKKTRVNGVLFWQVTVPKLGGGRSRRTFKNREEAQTFLNTSKVQQTNFGTAALSMDEVLRVEAMDCARRLEEFGRSLRDATDHYIAHLRQIKGSKTVAEVYAEYMKVTTADGASELYLTDLRQRVSRFVAAFGETVIATVSARQVSEWLRRLGVAPATRNTFRKRLASMFSFARRSGYLAASPMADVERVKSKEGEIGILTPEQVTKLLGAATEETRAYWALAAFTGLRRAEMERLDWSEVDAKGGFVEVKARKAKTGSRRLVPISANLKAWLAPYRNATGSVFPVEDGRQKLDADRKRAGLLAEWPANGLRHSYGSYRLPMIEDVNKLALEMGNSPAIVFRHYRQVVRPDVAKKFWKIAPAKPGGKPAPKAKAVTIETPANVVPMTAAA